MKRRTSLGVCWLCGEDNDELMILPGKLPGDIDLSTKGVWHKVPCAKCLDCLEQSDNERDHHKRSPQQPPRKD